VFDPFPIARPLLQTLDPETAHELTLRALELRLVPPQPANDDPSLATTLFGRRLSNPIGLAAGFDKNGRVYNRMEAQGFGFAEIGGVTPRPQAGNPRPRVFRLPEDHAIINRMGFPNDGADAVARRLAERHRGALCLGINLAANADSDDPIADFVTLVERFAPLADYLTLDISCPNTQNGQIFLDPVCLRELLARVRDARWPERRPWLVAKLAPEMQGGTLGQLCTILAEHPVDAIAVSNTTRERPPLRSPHANETGGLSGEPLFSPSTKLLGRVRGLTDGAVTLIGVGGVSSATDAYAKIRLGASAVQLYTGLVYEGTGLVTRIKRDLAALLRRDGFKSVAEAVGRPEKNTAWAG
jgi:dihydroorotate dehydrogenase